MTSLQIARNNWQENRRHQLASEAELVRHNAEMERLTGEANAETARSNKAREEYNRQALEESKRHSLAQESYSTASLSESQRASMAKELENLRHNQRTEAISSFVARTQNSREWKKLDLTEQLNQSSIALNDAKTYAQNLINFVDKWKVKSGLPKLEISKLRADIAKTLNDISVSQHTLSETMRKNRIDASLREQEQNRKDAELEWKKTQDVWNHAEHYADQIVKYFGPVLKVISKVG